jgi:hypothetical protein
MRYDAGTVCYGDARPAHPATGTPRKDPNMTHDVWKEERDRLAAVAAATRDAAYDAAYRHGIAIGLADDDARLLAGHVVDGIDATGDDVDRWTFANDAHRAGAVDRVLSTDPATYRDYDPALTVVDGAPFDPTWSRPRVTTGHGVTVRGARNGTVIGAGVDGVDDDTVTVRRAARVAGVYRTAPLSYRDALTIADALLRSAMPIERFIAAYSLIGTDTYSWHQIVNHRPATVTTTDGTTYAERPAGAGASIAGTARPARRFAMRRAGAHRFTLRVVTGQTVTGAGTTVDVTEPWPVVDAPVDVIATGWWPVTPWRVVKVYATTYDGGLIAPRHGWVRRPRVSSWQPSTGKSVKYMRDLADRNAAAGIDGTPVVDDRPTVTVRRRVASVNVATVADAIDAAATVAATVHGTDQTVTVRYRTVDGTTVTVAHEPADRRYRVTVAHRHGTGVTVRRSTTVRSVATVRSSADRMARTVRPV